jgi:Protein of unknown function (DUF3046)
VRRSEFWERMAEQFGAVYAQSVAQDQVIAGLGGHTVEQALAAGDDPKLVWRAVCEHYDLPVAVRH